MRRSDWIPPPQDHPPAPPPPPHDPSQTEVVLAAEAVVIRPGDTLVVRLPWRTTAEEAKRLHDKITERLPDVDVCMLPADQLAVIRRSGCGDE